VLTRKQYELLVFINKRLNQDGVSPSFDEMKDALRLRSKSGIHRLITGLEERGFLRRLAHRARALQVVKLPEAAAVPHLPDPAFVPAAGRAAAAAIGMRESGSSFVPQVIKGDFRPSLPGALVPANEAGSLSLPLYGKIAAGTPIEALRDNSSTIDVPASMLSQGAHYCLQVEGDSMIEAGINDGDIAIIKSGETADNGSIVVALIDDSEATLKRLRRKGATIALEAANPAYETRIFSQDRVKVQGRLVGLYRKF
jgi:repressor LexA